MNKKKIISALCLAALLMSASPALMLGQTAEEILRKVDAAMSGAASAKDLESLMTMTITSASGGIKTRKLRVWSRTVPGQDSQRLMKFLSPADVRDIGFLTLADDQMYLYLPEFRRIRRIASNNKTENFVGSDFSYEDLSAAAFFGSYTASLSVQDEKTWMLDLERKPGADKQYKKIRLTVSKEALLPVKMDLYDNAGNLVKVEEEDNGRSGKYWVPVLIRMKDIKAGSSTELAMSEIKTDQGLGDEVFSQRNLQKRAQ